MRIEKLFFSYDSQNIIFKDFDFSDDNKFVIFQGRSGCGKSTLLKLMSNNLKPLGGKIELSRDIGFKSFLVLQEDALFPWLTGMENLTAFLEKEETIGIENSEMYYYTKDFLFKKAYQMSFGQRRLIELFRAILYKPAFLFLDEPFNYLDEKSREVVSNVIFKSDFFRDTEQIVMTTHYYSDVTDIENIQYNRYNFNGLMPYHELEGT